MTLKAIKKYCLNKKGVIEDFPFGDDVSVMKVGSKMFALMPDDNSDMNITLKSDPVIAMDLRNKYEAVKPGYYMNKRHWNTIDIDGTILDKEIYQLVNTSYDLIFNKLKKSLRDEILNG